MAKFTQILIFFIISLILFTIIISLNQNNLKNPNLTGYITSLTIEDSSQTTKMTDFNQSQIFILPFENYFYSGEVKLSGYIYPPDNNITSIQITMDNLTSWNEIPFKKNDDSIEHNIQWIHNIDTSYISDGQHTFKLIALDKYENASEPAIISISIDNTPPNILFTQTEFNEELINLKFKLKDEKTKVNPDSISYEIINNKKHIIDKGNPTCTTECFNYPNEFCVCKILPTNTFKSGDYNLTIKASDSAFPKNTAKYKKDFIVKKNKHTDFLDLNPPIINFEVPIEIFIKQPITIDINATDNTGINDCKISIDNSEFNPLTFEMPCTKCIFSKEFMFESLGEHLIQISCVDLNENITTVKKTVEIKQIITPTVDTPIIINSSTTTETDLNPMIYTMEINNGDTFTNERNVNINISTNNVIKCKLKNEIENWSKWKLIQDVYHIKLPEENGEKTVLIQCKNKEDDIVETSQSIVLDTKPPEIIYVSPSKDLSTTEHSLKFIARINNDLSELRSCEFEIHINDEKIKKTQLRDSKNHCVLELTDLKKNSEIKIKVQANDVAGNTSAKVSFGTITIKSKEITLDKNKTIDAVEKTHQEFSSKTFEIKKEKIEIKFIGKIEQIEKSNTYKIKFKTNYSSSKKTPKEITIKVGDQTVKATKTKDGTYTLILQEEQLKANLKVEDGFGNLGVTNLPELSLIDTTANLLPSNSQKKSNLSILSLIIPLIIYAFIFAIFLTSAYYIFNKKNTNKKHITQQIVKKTKKIESINHLIKANKIEYFKRHISEETLKKRILEYQNETNILKKEINELKKQMVQKKSISNILKNH